MISELEIYQTAKVIMDRYGEAALMEAASLQDQMIQLGDLDCARIWERISDAIEFLQVPKTLVNQVIH